MTGSCLKKRIIVEPNFFSDLYLLKNLCLHKSWIPTFPIEDNMTEDPKLYRALGPVFISSIEPLLSGKDLIDTNHIKTIISVTKSDIPQKYKTSPYVHLQVPIDDLDSEIIFPYIEQVNKLVKETIYKPTSKEVVIKNDGKFKPELSGNAVLIHCQSGISRSVAFACAYLMNRHNLPLEHALHAIRRNNPEHTFLPNDGFLQQLNVYKETDWCCDVAALRKVSPRWRAYRMQYLIAPQINRLNSGGNGGDNSFSVVEQANEKDDENWFGFKCAKCRALLASSSVYLPHLPPYEKDDKQMYFTKTVYKRKRVIDRQTGHNECTHVFTEPLQWMKEKITNNEELEGRLDCYKCNTKVGGWNWKGDRCSCGKWIVPAIHLLKSKIVQVDKNNRLILQSDNRAV